MVALRTSNMDSGDLQPQHEGHDQDSEELQKLKGLISDLEALQNKQAELHFSSDPRKGKFECRKIFRLMLEANQGDEKQTYLFLFHNLKSCPGSQYLLGHTDNNDLGSWWEVRTKTWMITKLCYKLGESRVFTKAKGRLTMYVKSFVYSFDWVKDVRFLIVMFELSPQPVSIIALAISSLSLSEAMKMVYLASRSDQVRRRVGRCAVGPTMPVIMNHKESRLGEEYHRLAFTKDRSVQEEATMSRVRTNLHMTRLLKSEMRAVENILEHCVQVSLSLSVMELNSYGMTTTDRTKLILFSFVSLFSVVNGQMAYLSETKNGHLGFKAKILLVVYQVTAAILRVFMMYSCLRYAVKGEYIPIGVFLGVSPLHVALSVMLQAKVFLANRDMLLLVRALSTLLAPLSTSTGR